MAAAQNSTSINSRTVLSVTGFACFLAWFFLTFFNAADFTLVTTGSLVPALLGIGFVALAILSLAINRAVPRLIDHASKPLLLTVLPVAGALLPLYLTALPAGLIARMGAAPVCILMVVAAFPAVLLPLLWENLCGKSGGNTARLFAFSLCLGGVLCVLVNWLCDAKASWIFAIVFIAASAFALFVQNNEAAVDEPDEDLVDAPEIDRRIIMLAFTLSIGFGMAWPLATDMTPLMLAFSSVAVLAFSLFVNGPARLKDNTVIFLIRLCVTCLVIGFVVGQIIGGRLGAVCCFAVGAAWFIFWSLLDGLFIHRAQAAGITPAVYLSPIKNGSNAGFALGWVYATVVSLLAQGTSLMSWLIMGLALVVIVCCICLLPFGRSATRLTPKENIGAQTPLTMDEKMRRLIAIYALTPREAEIVRFMANGRNAGAIASKLVLSENTVRSHIYSIYGKIGVHSQQELIDLIASSRFDPLTM